MRFLRLSIFFLSSLLSAQSPEAEKAWAIYNSSSLPKPQQLSFLLEQLRSLEPFRDAKVGTPERNLIQLALDRLILSDTYFSAIAIEPFATQWPNEVLILLTRTKNPKALLWKLRDTVRQRPFKVHIDNLLIRHDPQRLHDKLLDETLIRHRFIVLGKSATPPEFATIGAHLEYLSPREDKNGFPPVGFYGLSLTPMEGATILSLGAQTVFYQRGIGDRPTDSFAFLPKPGEDQFPALAHLLNIPLSRIVGLWERTTTIPWTTEAAFREGVRNFV